MNNPISCTVVSANKPDKGLRGGSCNRTACQEPGATFFNHYTEFWYCRHCAQLINKANPEGWPIGSGISAVISMEARDAQLLAGRDGSECNQDAANLSKREKGAAKLAPFEAPVSKSFGGREMPNSHKRDGSFGWLSGR